MENGSIQDKITIKIDIADQKGLPFTIPWDKEGLYRRAAHLANHFIDYFEKTYHKGPNMSIALALIHGYARMVEEESRNDAYADTIKELLEETNTALKKAI